jgi:hypothetical protein
MGATMQVYNTAELVTERLYYRINWWIRPDVISQFPA